MIYHLKHNQIDKAKWDDVVLKSNIGVPYLFSWYCDIVSPDWEALVLNDYEVIMPLPLKTKLGYKYLVHPLWVQQWGIVSKCGIVSREIIDLFLHHIPCLSYDLNLNYSNLNSIADVSIFEKRRNVILKPSAQKNYSKNTLRNLRKAAAINQTLCTISATEFLNFWKTHTTTFSAQKYDVLHKLVLYCIENKCGQCLCERHNNIIQAAVFVIFTDKRIVYLAPVSSAAGKKNLSMFLIIDNLIDYCAKKNLILDFEGSQISGVYRFYKGFGGEDELYPRMKRFYPSAASKILHLFDRKSAKYPISRIDDF